MSLRDRLGLNLDVDNLDDAVMLAKELQPWFRVGKVGFELFSVAGPDAIRAVQALGYDVFADLKFYDIPTTVHRAARAMGRLGVAYLNFHTSGGVEMLRAGVEGLQAGADDAGHPPPIALGVTVLTSDSNAPRSLLAERMGIARDAGCGGVVCAATDLATLRDVAPELLAVVPGTRPQGASLDDQARSTTPERALADGAHVVLAGRAVTHAADRRAAAAAFAANL